MDTDYAAAIATDEVWVAAEDDQPVGLLVLKILNDHLLLENVAVSPDWQGRGIGAELLALAEGRACAAGVTEVRLYTHETMTENLQLYARHGYRETRRAKEDGFRRVFLTKPLPPPPWQKDPAAE